MYQTRLKRLLSLIWFHLIWLTLLLMAARFSMFHAFVEPAQLADKGDDLLRMWATGLRYDLRIAGMAVAPFLLLGLGLAGWSKGWGYLWRSLPLWLGATAFIVASVAIGNYFYYQTYHNHIDVFAFGLVDDDTRAVLANLWQDYPVIKGGIAATLFALPPVWFSYRVRSMTQRPWPDALFCGILVLSVILVAIAARGSVGTFPLRRGNAQVSDLTVLNKLTPNGLMAIDWAIKDHQDDIVFEKVDAAEKIKLLGATGLNSLTGRTQVNTWLANNKPHVVMSLMESFGSNMLALDEQSKNDLLGSLREPFRQDFVFKRFVSEGNGTAPSLAALFFHSPMENLSHSSAQSKVLTGTPFFIYKQAGYRVIFISPGNMMWRNLVNYLPVQGVDALYDQNALIEMYPESVKEMTDWGVPDEYAYQLAEKLLKDAQQPLFISILTVTNHPPYVVPSHYVPQPVAVTDGVRRHAEDGQIDQLNILRTYQYAADALGRFVADIKESALGSHTLIAASGDHQMRRVKAYYPAEQMLDRAVPFYLYVPKAILDRVPWRFESARPGSHKDIFPTLYAFSLSDVPYQALGGRNLLAPQDDPTRAFGYNETVWIDANGAYPLTGNPVRYLWVPGESWYLGEAVQPIDEVQRQRMQAYPALLRWQLNARVAGVIADDEIE